MTKEEIVRKLTSRRFWLMTAAFLGSIGASVVGITGADQTLAAIGTACAVLSAAIYAATEAAVDKARAASETKATTVSATTTAKEVVSAALGGTGQAPREG